MKGKVKFFTEREKALFWLLKNKKTGKVNSKQSKN